MEIIEPKFTMNSQGIVTNPVSYEGHRESKECFAMSGYSLIIVPKLNIQIFAHSLFHIVAFDIKTLVLPWYQHSSGLHHLRSIYSKMLLHF